MKDPPRLLEEGATAVERNLLGAGQSEEPAERSVQRAVAALGLAPTVGLAAMGTASASTAGTVSAMSTLTWVGGGLLVAGGLALGAYRLAPGQDAPSAAFRTQRAESTVQESVAGPEPSPPEPAVPAAQTVDPEADDSAAEVQDEPVGVLQKPAPAPAQKSAIEPAPASDAPPAATGDSIGAQVQMIDSARRQLGAGNASGALEQLDRYRQKYPQGMLGQEATLLRIEALAQGGNRAAARQLARRYLANHPNSQYSKRIQSLIGERKSDGLKPPEP